MTLADATLNAALERLAGQDRRITFLSGGDRHRSISFSELAARALSVLHHWQQRGIREGDEVVLVLNDNEPFVDAFWACLLGGLIAVPIAPGASEEQRRKLPRILARLRSPWLYTNQASWERIAQRQREQSEQAYRELRSHTVVAEDIDDISTAGRVAHRRPDDIAFVQFSSGSTSEPKGVVLTHANLLSNIQDIQRAARFCDTDVSLSWMPLTHDMGLIGFHLNMLLSGMNHILMATEAFIRRPLLWLQRASTERANVLCSPNFGYRHLLKAFRPERMVGVDLSHVRLIFNGAEPISASLCDEFLTTLAPYGLRPESMYPVYGLAEASLAVTFPEPGSGLRSLTVDRTRLGIGDRTRLDGTNTMQCVCVGRPIGAAAVRIVTNDQRAAPESTVGHIQISGPNVTAGFYQPGGRDRTGFTGDGWLDTGDLGFLLAGELYVTGRAKDILFNNGQNFYAHDLEAVAARLPGVELGKVVAGAYRSSTADSDEIILFVLHRGSLAQFAPLASTIATAVSEQTGAEISQVVPVNHIPKTTSGKLQRFALLRDYEAGKFQQSLAQLANLSAQGRRDAVKLTPTESALQEICDQVLGVNRLGRDDNFFEIGTNSLKLIEIHELVESRFPGRLEVTDLFDYPTLAKLAAYLDGKPGSAV